MYSEAAAMDIGTLFNCPFCRSNCYWDEDPRIGIALCICPICGKFRLSSMSNHYLNHFSNEERERIYKISFALRTVSEKALGKRANSFFPAYSLDHLRKILVETEPLVQEKLVLLLRYLGKITEHPGQIAEFDSNHDYCVVCAKNVEEATFYFDSLVEQGLVSREQAYTGEQSPPRFKVTASGWKELNRIEQLGAESSNAFIAMSFHPDRDPFEKAISEAVRAAGYLPVRVDQIEHVNRIDDEIIARIRSSKFLISDFTSQRTGVYFEAGFMLGLGRPVIWLCEKEDLKNVHFDTRQYNTIDYKDAEDLQTRLQFRIEAILGKGPHKDH
jgi:nucleoside 2-deoxyribosyltransferase